MESSDNLYRTFEKVTQVMTIGHLAFGAHLSEPRGGEKGGTGK